MGNVNWLAVAVPGGGGGRVGGSELMCKCNFCKQTSRGATVGYRQVTQHLQHNWVTYSSRRYVASDDGANALSKMKKVKIQSQY